MLVVTALAAEGCTKQGAAVGGVADGSLAAGIAVMIGVNIALWLACHRMLASGYKLKP